MLIDLDETESELTEDNLGVTVPGNGEIVVSVADGSASTGFAWSLADNQCGVRFTLVDEGYEAANNGLIGAPGKKTWTFNTPPPEANYVRGAPCDVTFTLGRAWEADADKQQKKLRVNIQ